MIRSPIFIIITFWLSIAMAEKPLIITTVPFLEDIVKEITCDSSLITRESLIERGSNPHTYKLTPASRAKMQRAEVVIAILPGFYETWIPQEFTSSLPKIFVATEGLPLRKTGTPQKTQGNMQSSRQYDLSISDPHVWQSPLLVSKIANNLARTLNEKFPTLAKTTSECKKKYNEKISQQKEKVLTKIASIPKANRLIATNHDALWYFADSFGFEIVPILGLSPDAATTPKQLEQAMRILKARKIKTVFLEEGSISDATVRTVANNLGLTIGGSLIVDTLGKPESTYGSILQLWEYNASILASSLK